MKICGLNKTTLLDYPEHVAATVFLGKCNFRCPFCHNKDLVIQPEYQPEITEEYLFSFLNKRKGILSGVCITGGEPTLEPELADFIYKIKQAGYLVKLDTNGYRPEILKDLAGQGLLDYIAMDIKNCFSEYGRTAGISNFEPEKIKESIQFIMSGNISYEFRTTVVREFHTQESMLEIGKEIEGAKAYFLQNYEDSGQVISPGLHAAPPEELKTFAKLLQPYIENVSLRGI